MEKILQILIKLIMSEIFNIEKVILPLLDELTKSCPKDLTSFKETYNKINGIKSSLQSVNDKIQQIRDLITPLNTTVEVVDVGINIIKVLPIPLAVPPGVGVPANVPITFSDILATLQQLVKTTKSTTGAVLSAIEVIAPILQKSIDATTKASEKLNKCLNESDLSDDDKSKLFLEITKDEPKALDDGKILPYNPTPEDPTNVWNFRIENRYEGTSKTPQRRVVAGRGIEVVFGNWSYSETTDILVKEVQFIIKNKNKSPQYYTSER